MDIKYLGHSSFLLKGKTGSVVTDPYGAEILQARFPKVEADIVTISHQHDDHNAGALVQGTPLVISLPGEYEKKQIRIQGFATHHDKTLGTERGKNTIYKITIDEIDILHCGDLGHTLKGEILDEIGSIDVLLVPVGGNFTINADEANTVVSKLEPTVVIPMHYSNPYFDKAAELMGQLAPVSEFLQKMGSADVEPVKSLTIKKADLNEEEVKVVVFSVTI